jgi:K+-transporting ATPase c subunit
MKQAFSMCTRTEAQTKGRTYNRSGHKTLIPGQPACTAGGSVVNIRARAVSQSVSQSVRSQQVSQSGSALDAPINPYAAPHSVGSATETNGPDFSSAAPAATTGPSHRRKASCPHARHASRALDRFQEQAGYGPHP